MKRWLTVQEALRVFPLGRSQFYAALAAGTIPSVRLSPRRLLIPAAALEGMEREALQRAQAAQERLTETGVDVAGWNYSRLTREGSGNA